MITYLVRRLVAMIPTLLGITFVTFMIMNLAPGDPVSARFQVEGGGAEGEGAAGRERQQDAIKAKRRLLGFLRENRAALSWRLPASPGEGAEFMSPVEGEAPKRFEDAGHSGALSSWPLSLAIMPDGSRLWTGCEDGHLRSIDTASRRVVADVAGHDVEIRALAVTVDGARLASADTNGVVRAWDGRSGGPLWKATSLGKLVRDLAFLPDGRLLVAADDGGIRLLGLAGEPIGRLEGHVAAVNALVISRDGRRAWSAGYDRSIREWDLGTLGPAREVARLGQPVNDLALAPDESFLVAACSDRQAWHVSLATPAEPPRPVATHVREVTAVALSADGRTLVSGSRDESLRVSDVATGRALAVADKGVGAVHGIAVSAGDGRIWSVSDSWTEVPVAQRYLHWLSRMMRLDFDRSFKDDREVMVKIGEALPVTLGLNVLAILIIYLVAIPVGVFSAARRGSRLDHATSIGLFALYSVPNFWLATLLIMTFSSTTSWDLLPSVGLHAFDQADLSYVAWLKDSLLHLVLPIIVLTYAGFASLSRYARTSMLEAIGQDYVRTARAKGLAESVVLWRHAFRNSLITIVTLVGNLLPAMIGGSVIVEQIFTISGMGKLGFEAILARDYPVVMAITTFSALLTLLGILVSDVLYGLVDPRITHK